MEVRTYQGLLEKYASAKQTEDWETAYEIAACINVGLKLRWTEEQIVRLSERVKKRVIDFDHLRDKFDSIWEADAEVERLMGTNHNNFSWFTNIIKTYSCADKCAPLILIRAQAAINVAFQKAFGMARSSRRPFNASFFEGIAVYQFRVPGQEASDNIDYLLKRSNIGRHCIDDHVNHKLALASGIERSVRMVEKEQLIGATISIDGGRECVGEVLAKIVRRKNDNRDYGINVAEQILSKTALGHFDDQCWLLLDHVVRKERGWGVLGTELQGVVLSRVVALKYR